MSEPDRYELTRYPVRLNALEAGFIVGLLMREGKDDPYTSMLRRELAMRIHNEIRERINERPEAEPR